MPGGLWAAAFGWWPFVSLSSDATESDSGGKGLEAGDGVLKVNLMARGVGEAGGSFGFETVMVGGGTRAVAGGFVEGPSLGRQGPMFPKNLFAPCGTQRAKQPVGRSERA